MKSDIARTYNPFSEKHIGSEEFFNQMFEALGITIDRRPKRRPRKMES